jgi:hypothetical protein
LILSEQAEPGTLADMGNDDNGDVWLLKPAHFTSDLETATNPDYKCEGDFTLVILKSKRATSFPRAKQVIFPVSLT